MDGFICYHQTSYHNLLEMTSNCRWGGDGVGVGGGVFNGFRSLKQRLIARDEIANQGH